MTDRDIVDIRPSVYTGWVLLVDSDGRTFPVRSTEQTEFLAKARFGRRSAIGEAT